MDGKFSVGYRDAVVRTVVSLDRETTAAYTLILEAIGACRCPPMPPIPPEHHRTVALGRVRRRRPPRSQLGPTPEPGLEPEALP